MLRVIRANEHQTSQWKNGHGSTTRILVHPEQASIDTFEYRINTATVNKDEPFSRLPGVKRTLFILEGEGLHLTLGEDRQIKVTRGSAAFLFDVTERPTHNSSMARPSISTL